MKFFPQLSARYCHGPVAKRASLGGSGVSFCSVKVRPKLATAIHRKQVNQTWEFPLKLDQDFLSHLQWFTYSRITQGVPLQNTEPDQFFYMDASLTGWGTSWKDSHISGSWTSEHQGFHINWLEMEAVRLAVLHWGSQTPSGKVRRSACTPTTAWQLLTFRKRGHQILDCLPKQWNC